MIPRVVIRKSIALIDILFVETTRFTRKYFQFFLQDNWFFNGDHLVIYQLPLELRWYLLA